MGSKSKVWTPPEGLSKTVVLESGKARIKVTHGFDTVEAKISALGRWLRDKNGEIRREKVKVPATSLKITLADGTVLKARSCCKPPDVFKTEVGINLAAKRLLLTDTEHKLSRNDRRAIMEALRPTLFKKKTPATPGFAKKPFRIASQAK
jgi:hypothetical protein